ncbi:MAG: transglutaminase family protein [Proteobacteria bacterium]|nr:transglutaminase family protein [Pseudomonadota bacterium]
MKTKIIIFFLFLFLTSNSYSKTLLLNGEMISKIEISQNVSFKVTKPLQKLRYRFAIPTNYTTPLTTQEVEKLDIKFSVRPVKTEEEKDREGNVFKVAYFENVDKDIDIVLNFVVNKKNNLKELIFNDSFPVKDLSNVNSRYLSSSPLVQSDDERIKTVAIKLAEGTTNLYDVVNRVINYVSDNVKYTYNPQKYDAVFTLETKSGNCQNIAHLSIALLRALNIPARIVGGITLKEQWKIPLGKDGYLVQSMGQGGHAWIEVYFPSYGWLPFDPQQTKNFVSTRHIKQTHGVDSNEVNDSWSGGPTLPRYEEEITAKYLADNIDIKLSNSEETPKAYIASNSYKGLITKMPELPEKKPEEKKDRVYIVGNINFPNLVNLFLIKDDKGQRILDKETAEYVTSKDLYAQRFDLSERVILKEISLAMHKFGGDGAVYIDVLEDEEGRPSLKGFRSNLLFLKDIERKAGYYWVDFKFDENTLLEPKKYWIVIRRSGEAIMNWFYIPGNPFGDGDDTRSTKKGWDWNDILNYDFVFRVKVEKSDNLK